MRASTAAWFTWSSKRGATLDEVEKELKADDYFAHDELHVFAVKSVDEVRDMGHGVHMTRKA